MGALNIPAGQLAELKALRAQINNGVTVADVWKKLADFGDSYRNTPIDSIVDVGHGKVVVTDPDDTTFTFKLITAGENGITPYGQAYVNADWS